MSLILFLAVLAVLAGLAFLFAAASLLADYLAAHRRTELPPHLGHHRLGIENENAPTLRTTARGTTPRR